ncbi:sulfite exporter TauE/SafE family protein [Candidatus Formimonas warabiya]|nr:sulfite exporter TauE/SafE family protein [Candidatus Formimonas warabiya]
MHIVLVISLGLLAGILSSLLGVGGGIILVPGMMYLLKIPIKTAIGTSLAIILPTAIIGVYRHGLNGNVNWKVTLLISLGTVTGAYLGVWLNEVLSVETLRKIFVVLLIVMAIKIWRG